MTEKPIFYDSEVLICFLEIDATALLKKLFSKIIIPEKVYNELTHEKTPDNIKSSLKKLIKKIEEVKL